MRDFPPDLQRFCNWLDSQIVLYMREGKRTVIAKHCDYMMSLGWENNQTTEDAICYSIIEEFLTAETEYCAIVSLEIFWDNKPHNEILKELLLCIPLQYISMMLQAFSDHAKPVSE